MTLSIDELRSSLTPKQDLVLDAAPTDPEMRESISIWLFEDTGTFGFPRVAIEAEGTDWNSRQLQMNFAFTDGRILDGGAINSPQTPLGADGVATTLDEKGQSSALGAGGLIFRCIEPFRTWMVNYDGKARDGQASQQLAGQFTGEATTPLRLEAELTSAAPAWVQAPDEDDTSAEAAYMGLGYRFEQLFRAKGVVNVDGKDMPFTGSGIRVHRQSIRRLEGFYGHCWQSALFPDGSGFSYVAYPPKDDRPWYNIGFIYRDGKMYPAKAKNPPFLKKLIASGEDVSFDLESEFGTMRIEASSLYSMSSFNMPTMAGFALHQAGARYTWNGQTAIGMLERSSLSYEK